MKDQKLQKVYCITYNELHLGGKANFLKAFTFFMMLLNVEQSNGENYFLENRLFATFFQFWRIV